MRSKLSQFISVMALAAAIVVIVAAAYGGNDQEKMATERGTAMAVPAAGSGTPAFPLGTPVP